MTITTKTVWLVSDLTLPIRNTIQAQLEIAVADGKTDGQPPVYNPDLPPPIPGIQENTPIEGQRTITRVWNTQQSAEDWHNFLIGLSTPPISTEVVVTP